MGTNDEWNAALGGCIAVLVIIGLKLWALWWLYHFVATWITTGVVPSFWTFVWAAFLVAFVFVPSRSSSKD